MASPIEKARGAKYDLDRVERLSRLLGAVLVDSDTLLAMCADLRRYELEVLRAEVERLKETAQGHAEHAYKMGRNYADEVKKNDSLRDLVREARQLISPSHPTAVSWLAKSAKV